MQSSPTLRPSAASQPGPLFKAGLDARLSGEHREPFRMSSATGRGRPEVLVRMQAIRERISAPTGGTRRDVVTARFGPRHPACRKTAQVSIRPAWPGLQGGPRACGRVEGARRRPDAPARTVAHAGAAVGSKVRDMVIPVGGGARTLTGARVEQAGQPTWITGPQHQVVAWTDSTGHLESA